jgi:hypothetical protein
VNGSPWVTGPISNGFVPDITFNSGNTGSLADSVKNYEPTFYDGAAIPLKYVGQKSFVTSAGVKGIRCQSVDPYNETICAFLRAYEHNAHHHYRSGFHSARFSI